MKVLDVSGLQSEIAHTVTDIEKLCDQISTVQRAIRDFVALDHALSGKGGEAIRAFYDHCHQPFLVYLHQSLIDYTLILNRIQEAVASFEPDANGYIHQAYLEEDVKSGLEDVESIAKDLTEEANAAIDGVQDIISLPRIVSSEVTRQVQRGKDKIYRVVRELHQLDQYAVSQLMQTGRELNTMMTYLEELEAACQAGDLSVKDYSVSAASDMKAFHVITESVFGEGGIFGPILRKFMNGEPITAFESDSLYHYFQTIILDDGLRRELETVASWINAEDIARLEQRLNEKVVVSDAALAEEMLLVQAYLFLGTHVPSETGVEYDTRIKLASYLMLLKSYHSHMVENNEVIMVGKLDYKEDDKGIPGHYIESWIDSFSYSAVEDLKSKEAFRDWVFFDPENVVMPRTYVSSIRYATGPNASANIQESELKNLEMQYARYEANFVTTEMIKHIISGLAKKADVSDFVDAAKIAIGYDSGKKELEKEILMHNVLTTADRLALEISMSEERPGKDFSIQFHPIDSTFAKIERWYELHRINPDIPFPYEEILAQDWYEIGEALAEVEDEFGTLMYQYISDGSDNGKSIESLANEGKGDSRE